MRKSIVFLIIGFMLGFILPASAQVIEYSLQKSDCSLYIDGDKFNDTNLPLLNYSGYNYIPVATFKEIAEKSGAEFKWNNLLKRIDIKTPQIQKTVTDTSSTWDKLRSKELPIMEEGEFYILEDTIGDFKVIDSNLDKYECTHLDTGKNGFDDSAVVKGYWENGNLFLRQRTGEYSEFEVKKVE